MDRDKARIILETWINDKTSFEDVYQTLHRDIDLPIVDENIYKESEFEQWSFKGLLKIAYNLKDND